LRILGVMVEEVVDVEVVNELGVVASHMIVFKTEAVGDREDPVLKELMIRERGCRILEVAAEINVRKSMMAEIEWLVGVEAIQGRCSSD